MTSAAQVAEQYNSSQYDTQALTMLVVKKSSRSYILVEMLQLHTNKYSNHIIRYTLAPVSTIYDHVIFVGVALLLRYIHSKTHFLLEYIF